MKRARHYEPTADKGYEVDPEMNNGGPNGDGQGSTSMRGFAKDKNNRKLSCKECRRYVRMKIDRHHFLTISRLKVRVRHSSISVHQVV